jgi:tRNA/rRNA methyltransferase
MAFYAYILRCDDGSYYAGHTDNLEQRVAQHQAGEIPGYTFDRRPVTLMWSRSFPSRAEALAAELEVKSWSPAKKEALFKSEGTAGLEAAVGASGVQSRRTSPPVIVLVRPQLGENIGKAARAMLNFGLTEMRLVTPRDGWPNPAAGPAASGADIVLANARVFDSVAEAVADCPHVYATTVRKRGVVKPVVTPEHAAVDMRAAEGRSAILFGPERSGLETDDVALARTILTVPINPEFGSLNLAQAVILVAYEWSKGETLASPPEVMLEPPAPQEELEGMLGQLDAMLVAANFFFPPDRVVTVRRTIRTLFTKPGWTSQEVRTLRGIFSALAGAKAKRSN